MRPPRRIFRGSTTRRRPILGRTVTVAAVAVVGTAALAMTVMSTDLFGNPTPPPAHLAADQVAVIDGGTLRLGDHVVRLQGIAAPERGDKCLPSQDCGEAASAAMAGFVHGRHVDCALSGHDNAGRPFAACTANGADLSRAIVASGWARAKSGAPELADLELRARRQRQGLWADASAR